MDSLETIGSNRAQGFVLDRGLTDLLKFISAIMIAIGHYSAVVSDMSNNPIYHVLPQFTGYVGVAIFFFLSGYGLMMSEKKKHLDLLRFLKKRLSKVYLPVVMVTLIWQIVIWPEGQGLSFVPRALYNIFWGFSDGILWFVKVIVGCYVAFYIYASLKMLTGGGKFLSLILITAILYALVYLLGADWEAISVPLFSLGIIVADFNKECFYLVRSWRLLLFVAIITLLMLELYQLHGNLYIHSLINWYVILFLLVICAEFPISIKLPSWMGECSYDIYITHYKVIYYLTPIMGYIGLSHFLVGALITTAASFSLRKLLKI